MAKTLNSRFKNLRISTTTNAFLVEEKLESCIDLSALLVLQTALSNQDKITIPQCKSILHLFGVDTIAQLCLSEFSGYQLAQAEVTPLLPAILLNKALRKPPTLSNVNKTQFRELLSTILSSAQSSLTIQLSHMMGTMSDTLSELCSDGIDKYLDKFKQLPSECVGLMRVLVDMQVLVKKYRENFNHLKSKSPMQRAKIRQRKGLDEGQCPSLGLEALLCKDLIVFSVDDTDYLLDKGLFLECYNKLTESFCVLVYNHFQSGVSLPNNQYEVCKRFLSHITKKVLTLGKSTCRGVPLEIQNSGFNYLKIMEGLGVSEMIRRSDGKRGWVNTDLQENLWKSVYDGKLDSSPQFLTSELNLIWTECSIPQIADLLGLVKLAGHPSLEIEKGLEELYKRTHENIIVDEGAVERITGIITRDLIQSFYRRLKRYPIVSAASRSAIPQLDKLMSRNIDPTSPMGLDIFRSITIQDWSTVRFEKNEEFDPIDNQLPLLKDKAIGLTRSKVFKLALMKNVESSITDPTVYSATLGKREERRVLLTFLLSPHFSTDFQRYFDSYCNQPEWQSDVLEYLVIKLTGKELEMKPKGRMFGASPVEERNRRIVQEYNLMRFMDDYVIDQLMTPNELTMVKKLYSFRHLHVMYPNHTILQISFDFSKWNNSMRHKSIDIPAGIVLDNWFGVSLYGKTMLAYESSKVYYADKLRYQSWDGQLGGIEGLNQATWSMVFIGGIKSCLERLGVIYQLTVKGDDVRAAIAVPNSTLESTKDGIDGIKNNLLDHLQSLCLAMGWQLNPHECFVSLALICTSKQYQVNDTWLPAGAKKMMKLMSLSNMVLPTLEDLISNIFSTCHSACSQTTCIIPAFSTALVAAAYTMITGGIPAANHVDKVSILLLWPQILGGPGALPLQVFFVRGENDMLSVSISLMRHILSLGKEQYSYLIRRIMSVPFDKNRNYQLLIADPYAISLEIPERPQSVLRRIIRKTLRKWVRNPVLKPLLSPRSERDLLSFQKVLLSCKPYLAKLCTFMWECSPFAIVDEIIAKFLDSSTIFALLEKGWSGRTTNNSAYKGLATVLRAAEKRITFWCNVISGHLSYTTSYYGVNVDKWLNPLICSTEITHMIREQCWGFPIVGLTYPSLVDQNWVVHPEDLGELYPHISLEGCYTQLVLRTNSAKYQTDEESLHYASAPGAIPWLGSQTSSKVELPNAGLDIQSPILTKILRLINIRRLGAYIGTSFINVIECLLKSLTSIGCTQLLALSPEVGGGQLSHRVVINSFSPVTMPNYRPNIAQILTINDETLKIIQNDQRNRTINFAARHYYLTIMALFPLQFMRQLPQRYPAVQLSVFHGEYTGDNRYQLCPWCCNVVDDGEVSFDSREMPILDHYRSLALVGASDYDNKVLDKAVINAVKGRARRLLQGKHVDISEPLLVDMASLVVLNRLMRDNVWLHQHAMSLHYQKVPEGQMLSIMSVAMGRRALDHTTLSINAIRAIPPKALYEAVRCCTFSWFTSIIETIESLDDIEVINFIQAHMNSLTPLFGQLTKANALRKIALGCSMSGDNTAPLMWSHGSDSSAEIACRSFLEHHTEVFKNWITHGCPPPSVKLFVQMENYDTIQEYLMREYRKYKRLIILHLNKMDQGLRPAENILNNVIIGHENYMGCHIPDVEFYEWLSSPDHDLLPVIQPLLMDERFIRSCVKVGLMVNIELHVSPGDWLDGDGYDDLLISEYTLCDSEQELTITVDNPESINFNNLESLRGVFSNHLQPLAPLLCRIVNICCNSDIYIEYGPVVEDSIFSYLRRYVEWYGKRITAILTPEDAERALRGGGAGPPEVETVLTEIFDSDVVDNPNIEPDHYRCLLPHQTNRNDKDYDTEDLWVANLPASSPLLILEDTLGRYENLILPLKWQCDSGAYFRFVGGTNMSVARFLETVTLGRIRDYIDDKSNFLSLSLGDGGGSMSAMITKLWKKAKVLLVTLSYSSDDDQTPADASVSNPPNEFLPVYMKPDTVCRVDYTSCYPGDLTSQDVNTMILQYIVRSSLKVRLIMFDVDCNFNDSWTSYKKIIANLHRMIIKLCEHKPVLILKLYPAPILNVTLLIYYVYRVYKHVHLLRSRVSHLRQKHIILFATGHIEENVHNDSWEVCLTGGLNPVGNMECMGNIISDLNQIIQDHTFIAYTGNRHLIDSNRLMNQIRYSNLDIAPPSTILSRLTITIPDRELDFCQLDKNLILYIQEKFTTIEDMVNKLYPILPIHRRKMRVITTQSGVDISKSSAFVNKSIHQLCTLRISELLFQNHSQVMRGDIKLVDTLIGWLIEYMISIYGMRPIDLHIYLWEHNYIISHKYGITNLTRLIRSGIENYLRYIGWKHYICSALQADDLTNSYPVPRSKPLIFNDCCREHCNTRCEGMDTLLRFEIPVSLLLNVEGIPCYIQEQPELTSRDLTLLWNLWRERVKEKGWKPLPLQSSLHCAIARVNATEVTQGTLIYP